MEPTRAHASEAISRCGRRAAATWPLWERGQRPLAELLVGGEGQVIDEQLEVGDEGAQGAQLLEPVDHVVQAAWAAPATGTVVDDEGDDSPQRLAPRRLPQEVRPDAVHVLVQAKRRERAGPAQVFEDEVEVDVARPATRPAPTERRAEQQVVSRCFIASSANEPGIRTSLLRSMMAEEFGRQHAGQLACSVGGVAEDPLEEGVVATARARAGTRPPDEV
jgi:hypothetical protein